MSVTIIVYCTVLHFIEIKFCLAACLAFVMEGCVSVVSLCHVVCVWYIFLQVWTHGVCLPYKAVYLLFPVLGGFSVTSVFIPNCTDHWTAQSPLKETAEAISVSEHSMKSWLYWFCEGSGVKHAHTREA